MLLEDYLDFTEPDIIQLKGHRIFLEDVLERWNQGYAPEHIAQELPSLTLEEVYAAIAYYLHNQKSVDAYLERGRKLGQELMRQADANPSPVVLRLRALKKQRLEATHASV